MPWWQFALWGAGGGGLFECLAIFNRCREWQVARRTPIGRVKANPPKLEVYLDVRAHLLIAFFRMALGAGVATLFGTSGQISGSYAAIVFGLSAPALLANLGNIPQVADAISRSSGESATQRPAVGTGNSPAVGGEEPLIDITPGFSQGGGNHGR